MKRSRGQRKPSMSPVPAMRQCGRTLDPDYDDHAWPCPPPPARGLLRSCTYRSLPSACHVMHHQSLRSRSRARCRDDPGFLLLPWCVLVDAATSWGEQGRHEQRQHGRPREVHGGRSSFVLRRGCSASCEGMADSMWPCLVSFPYQ